MKAAKMAGFTKNENIPKNEKFSNLGKSMVGPSGGCVKPSGQSPSSNFDVFDL